jgi:hypothetical protein
MALNREGSSPSEVFECFNINCYASFTSERGLRQHLWRSASCKEYMLIAPCPLASNLEIVGGQRRTGYSIESTRLNPAMSTDPPCYSPYKEFEYDDYAGNVDDDAGVDELLADEESENNVSALVSAIDETVSSPVINAIMERLKARDRHAITVLQRDIEHRNIVNLMKILEDGQCPDYMLQLILQWAYNAQFMGFDFNPKATSRKANIQWMYQALEQSHQRLPQVISINLEDHDAVQDIVCFDFVPALLSLLQDDNLMLPENLVVNLDDPTSMYMPSDNKFGEAHTGERYRDLFRELITARNQLLVPIIMFLDGTAIDSKGHIEVCPVSFTTSLFTEKVRRKSNAWRLLGYVPDLNRGRSCAMNSYANSTGSKGRTTRNFHKVMDVILKGLATGQAGEDRRLKKVPLKVGAHWIVVDIVCPLLFVINDGKQGDQLCCRTNGHHRSQRRHHRSCDCGFDDLDNPDVQCTFLTTDAINEACRNAPDDVLHQLTVYRVDNAFNRIQMGQNPHGIFMCAVVDVMHTVQHGIIMYCLESFKKGLGAETLHMMDVMAITFDETCCQSIRSSFPRTDFSRGITNLTLVECSEQSGTLFLLSALTMRVQGWHALASSFPNVEAVLRTMECLLCFEAWLDQPTFWEIGDATGETAERAEAAIASLMRLIVKYLPREKGNGWKVSKFHEIKHIVRFIVTFGAPRGYNASRPEEHHKAHAKRPGRRSQKNVKTIDQQCGRRIADAYIIDTMHALFQGDQPGIVKNNVNKTTEDLTLDGPSNSVLVSPEPRTVEKGSGTTYHIRSFRDPENNNQVCREVTFNTQTRGPMNLEENLSLFILQNYRETDLDMYGEGCIKCCTEYHKYDVDKDEKLISIRCHPNYRGKGFPWYDWAVIRFKDDNGDETDFPSRILSCIPRYGSSGTESPTYDIVIQCCDEPTGRESQLFTEWSFNKDFYVVSTTAIVGLCFVLVSSEIDGTVLVVKDRSEWASTFYDAASFDY